MGIRFLCHHCEHRLNVKSTQAGQEGQCPKCGETLNIPVKSTIPSSTAKSKPRRRPSHTESNSQIELLNVDEQMTLDGVVAGEQKQKPTPFPTSTSTENSQKVAATSKVPNLKKKKVAKPRVTSEIIKSEGGRANDLFMLDKPAPPSSMGKIDPIAEAPKKVWYFRSREIGEKGPLKAKEMQKFVDSGDVCVGAIVWREDWEDWMAAEKVFPDLAVQAKAIKQKNMVDRALRDANYQIPDEFNPHSALNKRLRRKNRIFIGAIACGIIVIGILVVVLVKILSK